jgi:hypothetical protein
MAEIKFFFFANLFGWSILGIAPFVVDKWQAYTLWGLGVIFIIQKIYFGIRKNVQDLKNRDLSLKKKKHDVDKELEE